jgi:hypothetical protein
LTGSMLPHFSELHFTVLVGGRNPCIDGNVHTRYDTDFWYRSQEK